MNITHFSIRRFVIACCLLLSSPNFAHAAVDTFNWQLTATVDVSATIGGKTITLKKQPLPKMIAIFKGDQRFVMDGEHWQLTGSWSQKGNSFKLRLNDDSVQELLSTMEHDLLAQSNLGAQLALKSHQGSGSEKQSPSPSIQGQLPIKATLTFPAYANKTGSLTLNIRFTGQTATTLP